MFDLEDLLLEASRRKRESGCFNEFFSTEKERQDYPHWMQFFEEGKTHHERLAMCANQVGKTTAGLFEVTAHVTGRYPEWWTGHRFDGANTWWVCGTTLREVRDVLQARLLGQTGQFGTGFIPADALDFESLIEAKKAETLVSTFRIKHVSGGFSTITFKSYESGREAFQGMPGISVLLDEEPDISIYGEAIMRTIAGNNRVLLTFTPLKGVSTTVLNFLGENDIQRPSGELSPSRWLTRATWNDAPHLDEAKKAALLAALPQYQRDARTLGIPTLGAGAIYQVSEETVFIDPFEVPEHWPRCYGLDVGWKVTAAIWGAIDRDSNTLYLYSEYYGQEAVPAIHAAAIRARGEHIFGAVDPAARGRGQDDGQSLMQQYHDLGLNLVKADNSVEPMLWNILSLMQEGRLKIFKTCTNTLREFRMYRRDEKGKVVKTDDHVLDALRYLVASGRDMARLKPSSTRDHRSGLAAPNHAW